MAYEQKDGQGSLFKHDKEGNDARPDLKGSITLDGKQYWLSAWTKNQSTGEKWLSLKAEQKEAKQSDKPIARNDDSIPF